MTGFDIGVLAILGMGAAIGFMRGFVHEVLALSAWVVSLIAIHYAHTPLTHALTPYVGSDFGASAVLAFCLLLLVPYVIIKTLARSLGQASRNSLLGPIDRVIGFGFGAVKGMLIAVLGFSVVVLGYDTVWGVQGRPDWITRSRSYPFINASSTALVKLIGERHLAAAKAASDASDKGPEDDEEKPAPKKKHRSHKQDDQ